MKSESSLPCWQEPVTGPYHESLCSGPRPDTLYRKYLFQYDYPIHAHVSQVVSSLQNCPTKIFLSSSVSEQETKMTANTNSVLI
jgi:hypothetical protein